MIFITQSFPNIIFGTEDLVGCLQCFESRQTKSAAEQELQERAKSEKTLLSKPFKTKSYQPMNMIEYYLVAASFMDEWRSFVRSPLAHSPPQDGIKNQQLLCAHMKLSFNPILDNDHRLAECLDHDEWTALSFVYSADLPIRMSATEESFPICEPCRLSRLLDYQECKVYLEFRHDKESMANEWQDEDDFRPLLFAGTTNRAKKRFQITIRADETVREVKVQVLL